MGSYLGDVGDETPSLPMEELVHGVAMGNLLINIQADRSNFEEEQNTRPRQEKALSRRTGSTEELAKKAGPIKLPRVSSCSNFMQNTKIIEGFAAGNQRHGEKADSIKVASEASSQATDAYDRFNILGEASRKRRKTDVASESRSGSSSETRSMPAESQPSKRGRVNWASSPKLCERFETAYKKLEARGEEVVPTALLKEMNVEGLTRENVASFLQKYRKRMTREAEQRAQRSNDTAVHHGLAGQTEPSNRLRGYIPAVPSNLSCAGPTAIGMPVQSIEALKRFLQMAAQPTVAPAQAWCQAQSAGQSMPNILQVAAQNNEALTAGFFYPDTPPNIVSPSGYPGMESSPALNIAPLSIHSTSFGVAGGSLSPKSASKYAKKKGEKEGSGQASPKK